MFDIQSCTQLKITALRIQNWSIGTPKTVNPCLPKIVSNTKIRIGLFWLIHSCEGNIGYCICVIVFVFLLWCVCICSMISLYLYCGVLVWVGVTLSTW